MIATYAAALLKQFLNCTSLWLLLLFSPSILFPPPSVPPFLPVLSHSENCTDKNCTENCTDKKEDTKKGTKNSPGDEIAKVNFLYDNIVHSLQNTIDSCINSVTDRRGGYVLERMFTKFTEITHCNGHYAVQGHSRSPILVPFESSYTTSY